MELTGTINAKAVNRPNKNNGGVLVLVIALCPAVEQFLLVDAHVVSKIAEAVKNRRGRTRPTTIGRIRTSRLTVLSVTSCKSTCRQQCFCSQNQQKSILGKHLTVLSQYKTRILRHKTTTLRGKLLSCMYKIKPSRPLDGELCSMRFSMIS